MKNSKPSTQRFPRHSAHQWQDIILRFQNDSLTIEEFCQKESIGILSFKKWRARYSKTRNQHKKSTTPDFIEITDTSVKAHPRLSLPPAGLIPWDIELELGNGIVCRIRKS